MTEFEDLEDDILKSVKICLSSSKLLAFNVEDIMALPQLRDGKFTKNFQQSDIKSAVTEVMSIQEQSAIDKDILVDCVFGGFEKQDQNG